MSLWFSSSALAQCSFNFPLNFEPDLFPNLPSGYDSNSYANEAAALSAAKLYFFGPTGFYFTPYSCRGSYTSVSISLVPGGGAGEMNFWESGTYPLSNYPGVSILQFDTVMNRCENGIVIGSVRQVFSFGHILACTSQSQLTLSGLTETRPAGTGGTSTVEITAKLTDGSQPKAGVNVGIAVAVAANTGGHDHDSPARPKGTLTIAGITPGTAINGVTDANGELKIQFEAPFFAGTHIVVGTCDGCTTPAQKQIDVKIPDLVELTADGSSPPSYTLRGADARHSSNHWFTQSAIDSLDRLITFFKSLGWQPVGVNDASLTWGGSFDIDGAWVVGRRHAEHRLGEEVDLSFKVGTDAAKIRKSYDKVCKKEGIDIPSTILWHGSASAYDPHFHVRLSGTYTTVKSGIGRPAPCVLDGVK